jgi:hypothetical protein
MTKLRLFLISAVLFIAFTAAAASTDPLQSRFLTPPASAKPQTWWHWMNGNITREGITADLEATRQKGIKIIVEKPNFKPVTLMGDRQ